MRILFESNFPGCHYVLPEKYLRKVISINVFVLKTEYSLLIKKNNVFETTYV